MLVALDAPPEALGKELLACGARHRYVAVCARLGLPDEVVHRTDLDGLAGGAWDPLSVVVVWDGSPAPKSLAWGLPDDEFTRVIRADPSRRGLLYCGTERGIHISFDDGVAWQRLSTNLPVTPIHDRGDPRLLFRAAFGTMRTTTEDDLSRVAEGPAR